MTSEQVDNSLLAIYVSLDKESEEYERVVYTFLDMFGFLGGLFDFMFFTGFIFIQFFVENSYLNSVFSKLYQIHVREYRSTQSLNFSTVSKNIDEDFKQHDQPNFINEDLHSNMNFKISSNSVRSSRRSNNSLFLEHLKQSLKNRRKYSFNLCDSIKNAFKLCIKSKNMKSSEIQKQGLK